MGVKVKQINDTSSVACVCSILAYYKKKAHNSEVRQLIGGSKRDVSVYDILQAFIKLGFTGKIVKGTNEYIHQIPLPAIALISNDQESGVQYQGNRV